MPVELISSEKKKSADIKSTPQTSYDNPKFTYSLLPHSLTVRQHVLNAESESTIPQNYAKSQARKGSEVEYVPASVTLSAYHIA